MNHLTLAQLIEKYPFTLDFFQQNRLNINGHEALTLAEYQAYLQSSTSPEDAALDIAALQEELNAYITQMLAFLGEDNSNAVQSLTIMAGENKSGVAEGFFSLEIFPSQIVSIVGPTGSGKSRLLADIEWAAQGDTPTGRSILINGALPDPKWRYSPNSKLVAQLSQNMNFVIDLTVGEFLQMHAECRMLENTQQIIQEILQAANKLAGEPFSVDTPVTSLSGGQSRALMIADTAILSKSPIVLIDEIENAGIDRKQALALLVSQDKIVLMATHDPLLALMADRRIVINNGGIEAILETSTEEKAFLQKLAQIDELMQESRKLLRYGKRLG